MNATSGTEPGGAFTGILSEEARALYLRAVANGGRTASTGPGVARPCAELLELGLLIPDVDDPSTMTVADPSRIAGRLAGQWQEQALSLLMKSSSAPKALQDLSHAYGSMNHRTEPGGLIEYALGVPEINQQIESLVEGAEKEVLTAQPGGSRPLAIIQRIVERDVLLLRRGVQRRTIYQPSARYSAPTRQYVERITEHGAEVRTLAEPFKRLIIVDREVAVIPAQDDNAKAAVVRDPAVVSYLIDSFEGLWIRSIAFPGATEVPQEVISRLRTKILRMMIQGVGHRVIARSLGISERTLARHIAEFREEYESETLFQLGWRMAHHPPHLIAADDMSDDVSLQELEGGGPAHQPQS
ncbi:hypothetical protein ABTX81_11470 [Kitasatospora sp. NPDC097605]|uniref:hypothetical protein n=1 Tax=Kitasatospora sp. NPDC097605 TaxID=3157226 RepID=UPI0033253AA1